ncbi:MAG: group II intron reverse transcriptase/maturase [Planctomycetota bacterium]
MNLEGDKRQMSRQLELPWEDRGEAPSVPRSDESPTAVQGTERPGADGLMRAALTRANMKAALRRVKKNRGSPGVDGMTVDELLPYLWEHWEEIKSSLLDGSYRPSPVKRQEIPKSGGGIRELGIPTVLDRLIQQALLQVLQPQFDPTFSEHSHGFRPGRSAHGAIREAQRYVQEGRRIVVDVDLERFFDRVNHDVLMGKLSKRIADKAVLGLIRRYLQSGVMVNGVRMERWEGTPQGGPLSPLLANVLLDEVDKELEKRGHAFVRYADDGRVFVRSRRAGERVLDHLRKLYGKLHLRINEAKSAVAPVWDRGFLGYSMWVAPGKVVRLRVAKKALDKMRGRVRQITGRQGGRSMTAVIGELRSYLTGWRNYFGLAGTPRIFATLDQWVRRRLRALQLKQWKRGRTVFRELRARGASVRVAAEVAAQARRWWWNACHRVHLILRNSHFEELGLPRLAR